MKYYKYYGSFYAVENGHLYQCEAGRGTAWEELPESSALEAVVILGPNAFPKETKKRHRLRRLLLSPFRTISLMLHGMQSKGEFITLSILLSILALFVGAASYVMITEAGRKNFDGGAPSHIVVQYDNGTAISYPIKNEKPIIVNVEERK